MKIDIYHLYRNFDYANFVYPLMLEIIKTWTKESEHTVQTYVCKDSKINWNTDADIVAFSVYTQMAPIVYKASERFRQAGKIVILGGPHFNGPVYQEALDKCDILVSSICKDQWLDLLEQINNKMLETKTLHLVDEENKFRYPSNLSESVQNMRWYQVISVPTSLGCPYHCDFCSPYNGNKYSPRNIDHIYNELKMMKKKWVFFADATFGFNKKHTLQLLEKIAPLKKNILIETTLGRLNDTDILQAMSKAGVSWISVGIETLSTNMGKLGTKGLDKFNQIAGQIHELGMLLQCNFICGLDEDNMDSFQNTYDFYEKSDIDLAIIDILTPYPNTSLYKRMVKEGRIINHNWADYNYKNVVFQPRNMKATDLIEGFNQLYYKITRPRFIFKKALRTIRLNGINIRTIIIVLFHIYNVFDFQRKRRYFKNSIGSQPRPTTPQHNRL